MAVQTYRDYVRRITQHYAPFSRGLGEALVGVLAGLVGDLIAEAAEQARRVSLLSANDIPQDALPLVGSESLLPRYPQETPDQHLGRLRQRWTTWQRAGTEQTLEGQLAAAGWPGVVEYGGWYERPGPNGELPYTTQFWVRFPAGTHPITGSAPAVGSFQVGDGTLVGAQGYTAEFGRTLRQIVAQWKPGLWICRGFVFDMGGATVGSFDVGDGTLVGGSIEVSL